MLRGQTTLQIEERRKKISSRFSVTGFGLNERLHGTSPRGRQDSRASPGETKTVDRMSATRRSHNNVQPWPSSFISKEVFTLNIPVVDLFTHTQAGMPEGRYSEDTQRQLVREAICRCLVVQRQRVEEDMRSDGAGCGVCRNWVSPVRFMLKPKRSVSSLS
jgi:hypothetical protein